MTASTPLLTDLARRLRNGTVRSLDADELDVVLGWITGAQRPSVQELELLLGAPDADPVLLGLVFEQLDIALFAQGNLNEAAAGVSVSVAETKRRARYRRLVAAFHPDRFPDLAAWLTPRSQAIHRAYTRFRKGEPAVLEPVEPTRPTAVGPRGPGISRKWRLPRLRLGFDLPGALRGRLRKVRHLEAKILATLATVFFFPVLVLSLSPPNLVSVNNGLPPSANPDAGVIDETEFFRMGVSATATSSLRSHGERLSRASIADDPVAHVMGPVVSPMMLFASREGRESDAASAPGKAHKELAAIHAPAVPRVGGKEVSAVEARFGPAASSSDVTGRNAARPDAVAMEAGDEPSEALKSVARAAALDAAMREAESVLQAAARRVAEREAAEQERAAREAAARRLAEREAAEQERAAREAAARRVAEHEAAEQERAAREAAARRVAEREAAEQERAARAAEAIRAAERQAATKPVAMRGATVEHEPSDVAAVAVTRFIESYRKAFENGDVVALMEHLGPVPRENEHLGRDWFETRYTRLFSASSARRILIAISDMVPVTDDEWLIHGYYDLRIDYRGRAPVRAHGPVRYRVGWHSDGWRIDSIQY